MDGSHSAWESAIGICARFNRNKFQWIDCNIDSKQCVALDKAKQNHFIYLFVCSPVFLSSFSSIRTHTQHNGYEQNDCENNKKKMRCEIITYFRSMNKVPFTDIERIDLNCRQGTGIKGYFQSCTKQMPAKSFQQQLTLKVFSWIFLFFFFVPISCMVRWFGI